MSDPREAMVTWIGVLARGGILYSDAEEEGVYAAIAVVGDDAVRELRAWFEQQDEGTANEQRLATIELCVWMAHADQHLADEERDLLQQIVAKSGLSADAQRRLEAAFERKGEIDDIAGRITHPALRRLMLALAWDLIEADHRIENAEVEHYAMLADKLGIPQDEAQAIRAAVAEQGTTAKEG